MVALAQLPPLLAAIAPLSTLLGGGVLGYYFKYYLDRRMGIVSDILLQKRAVYGETAQALQALASSRARSGAELNVLLACYPKLWLAASDEVMKAVNSVIAIVQSDTLEGSIAQSRIERACSECLLALRKDLRHTGLQSKDYGPANASA